MIHDPLFRTPDNELAYRLGRYVDALVAEDDTTPVATPEIADLAAIARALADAPRDSAPEEIHERARARLSAGSAWLALLPDRSADLASHPVAQNGRFLRMEPPGDAFDERAPSPLQRAQPILVLVGLAAAVLLVMYVAFGRHQSAKQPTPTVTPSPTSAPPPGVEVTGVGTVTMPLQILRPGSNTDATPGTGEGPFAGPWWVTTGRVILKPGEGGDLPSISPATGIGVEFLLEGSFTVSSGAPLRVVRSNGTTEEIPAETTVTLEPGDSVLHLDIGATQSWRNPGQTDAVLIGAGFYTSNAAIRQQSGTYIIVGGIAGEFWADMDGQTWTEAGMPDGPVVASIRRLTLAPESALPPAPEIYPALRWVEAGTVGWTAVGDGIATRPPGRPTTRFDAGQRLPWSRSSPGVQIVWSNPSKSDPAIVWEVVLTPAGPSPPSPVAT